MRHLFFLLFFCITFPAQSTPLPRYHCMTSEVDIDLWLKEASRSFDQNGLLMQKQQYHPLSIALFGILSYEKYMHEGRDERYAEYCKKQFRYFTDTAHYILIDSGKGMGLPYRFKFRDVKPPWFSGMTQGVAISYLLRYADLTKDTSVYPMIRKVLYFMLRDEKSGGALTTTKNGNLWIEEYPNFKRGEQVLNGFINALIGLREYTLVFPSDTAVKRIHDQCYSGLLKELPNFDRSDWTCYDANGSLCSEHYIRYEMAEMEHLYLLYHDEQFLRQLMIWSMFTLNRNDRESKSYYQPGFKYTIPLRGASDSTLSPSLLLPLALLEHHGKYADSLPVDLASKAVKFAFKNPVSLIDLRFDTLPEISDLRIRARFSGKKSKLHIRRDSSYIRIATSGKIKGLSIAADGKKRKLKSVRGFDTIANRPPVYVLYFVGEPILLEQNKKYMISYTARNLSKPVMLYRFAPSKQGVKRSNWNASRYQDDLSIPFYAAEKGYYELMFFFPFEKLNPDFSDFKLTEVKEKSPAK